MGNQMRYKSDGRETLTKSELETGWRVVLADEFEGLVVKDIIDGDFIISQSKERRWLSDFDEGLCAINPDGSDIICVMSVASIGYFGGNWATGWKREWIRQSFYQDRV